MGYFSNGSEGESYYEHYCSRCIHDNEEKGIHCPIWNLHLMRNYDQCNVEDSPLHDLIPRRQEGGNARCTMFIDRGMIPNLSVERIEHDALQQS